jgi:tetratricopeptide (TPR) repeat protein
MVQGPAAWYGMALLLIAIALDAAVCLAIARLQSKRESYLGWLMTGGLIVGALAVLGLKAINPHDLEPLRIYSFDLWGPPLLLWISLCGLETIVTILQLRDRHTRLWLATGVVIGLSFLVMSQPVVIEPPAVIEPPIAPDSTPAWWWPPLIWSAVGLISLVLAMLKIGQRLTYSRHLIGIVPALIFLASMPLWWSDFASWNLWNNAVLGMLPFAMSLLSWSIVRGLPGRLGWLRQGLAWVPGVVMLLNILAAMWKLEAKLPAVWSSVSWRYVFDSKAGDTSLMAAWLYLAWFCWPAIVGLLTPSQLYEASRRAKPDASKLPRPTGHQVAFLIASALVCVSLLIVLHCVAVDPMVVLGGAILLCILLGESVAHGPLSTGLELFVTQELWPTIGTQVKNLGGAVHAWASPVVRVSSMAGAIGKSLALFFLVLALSEVPNAGKTLILPFTVSILPEGVDGDPSEKKDLPQTSKEPSPLQGVQTVQNKEQEAREKETTDLKKRADLAQIITERVVNTLGILQQELSQEILLSVNSDDPGVQIKKPFTLVDVVGSANTLNIAAGKDNNLEYEGIKIPLGLLYAPVQIPMRWFLGVGIVQGSVHVERAGKAQHAVLLAGSNRGESWQIPWPAKVEQTTHQLGQSGSGPDNPHAACVTRGAMKADAESAQEGRWLPDMVEKLAEELAFRVIRADTALGPAFNRSWPALSCFRKGLQAWKRFETAQEYGDLREAMRFFEMTVREDPEFTLAHYRLGLAKQRDAQPGAAIKAFKASLKADPSFVPAAIALASVMYDFERISHLGEAGVLVDLMQNPQARGERHQEARTLWQQVLLWPRYTVALPNLASAYHGLCRQARFSPGTSPYLSHYYCMRAGALYARLSASRQDNPEVKKGEAAVLYALGGVMARVKTQPGDKEKNSAKPGIAGQSAANKGNWDCRWQPGNDGPFMHASLRYFLQALSLTPHDPRIRCEVAHAVQFVHKNGDRLKSLRADATVHLDLAEIYRKLGISCAFLERMELDAETDPRVRQAMQNMSTSDVHKWLNDRCSGNDQSDAYFHKSLQAYHDTITYDPNNIEALTGYAYTFWRWQVATSRPTEHGRPALDPAYARQAGDYARKAIALLPDNSTAQAVARSRLGQVLLIQGWPAAAIKEISRAIGELTDAVPDDPALDQMQWALAQAHLCTVYLPQTGGVNDAMEEWWGRDRLAYDEIKQLEKREYVREFQIYTGQPQLYPRDWGMTLCKLSQSGERLVDASPTAF